jgi:hypothetical protein
MTDDPMLQGNIARRLANMTRPPPARTRTRTAPCRQAADQVPDGPNDRRAWESTAAKDDAMSDWCEPILARALSIVNIHLMRARAAFRAHSQAATSRRSRFGSSILRSRHWPRSTPISISTMLSQLACLGV